VVVDEVGSALLHGDDIDRPNVWRPRHEMRGASREGGRNLAQLMRLAGLHCFKSVKDSERVLADPKRVPGNGSPLRRGQVPSMNEESSQLFGLAWYGFKASKICVIESHMFLPSMWALGR
jgi:hypothetical protein